MVSTIDDLAMRHLKAAEAADLAAYATALQSIPVDRLNTIGKEEAFQRSVHMLVPIARDGQDPIRRLKALALIGRADNTTQQKQPELAQAAAAAVAHPPPALDQPAQHALTPDQRYYIAVTVERSTADWVVPYAARALISESGEPRKKDDVRTAFASLLFERAPSIAEAFRTIKAAVPKSLHENPGTKTAELSRAKRSTKLLPAIEEAMRKTLRDSGAELAQAFNAMLDALVFRFARPIGGAEADIVAANVAEAALLLLGTLVRTRFAVAIDVETYKTVGRTQAWLKTRSWPEGARVARERLSQSLVEAIEIRAVMGSASSDLLQVLVQLINHRPTAVALIQGAANRPGVPSEVQDWIRAGGLQQAPRFRTDAAQESGLRDVDALIAGLALRGASLQAMAEGPAKAALADIRMNPDYSQPAIQLTQTFNLAQAIARDASSLAQRRSMRVFGTAGEVVDHDPQRHRQREGGLITTQSVTIEVPGVERRLPNGTTEVIVQAIVIPKGAKRK